MRPTLSQIKERLLAAMRASLGLTSQTRRSVLELISNAISGALYLLYTYVDNLLLNFYPQDATGDKLNNWGDLVGVQRKLPTFATGTVTVTGIVNAVLPQGTQIQSDAGVLFATDSELTLPAATGEVAITALVPGASGSLNAGDTLTMVSAVVNINATVTVTAASEGVDQETESAYRERIVDFFRRDNYFAGGIADYLAWVSEVPGAFRGWVASQGGEVRIYILKSDSDDVPTEQDINNITEYVEQRSPVTALVDVFAAQIEQVDLTIKIRNNTQATRDSATANIRALFDVQAQVRGTLALDGSVNTGVIYISQLRESVSQATGEVDSVITSHTANITPKRQGNILRVGTITYEALNE